MTTSELNILLARVLAILASTILSAFFALRLNFNKSEAAEELHLFIAVILFFVNIYVFTSFTQVPLFSILQSLGDAVVSLLAGT